jgi:hypothetical protein
MKTLILNSSNVVDGSNNSSYSVNVSGAVLTNKDRIALHSIMIPYSWFNISNAYSNNYFYYRLNNVQYKVDLGNQFLTMDNINDVLQYTMYSNGHYLIDSNNINWYPVQLSTNVNRYSIQIDSYRIPATLPSTYSNPGNVFYTTINSTNSLCQIEIPDTNIKSVFGLNAGIYPSSNTVAAPYSKLSDFTPNLSPVNTVVVKCNIANNEYMTPSDIIYSFTPNNVAFGENIIIESKAFAWINTLNNTISNIKITFVDQNLRPIIMQDNNVCIQLLIKNIDE